MSDQDIAVFALPLPQSVRLLTALVYMIPTCRIKSAEGLR
jgi:hypothetical protein